jgi:hypothetical protein
MPDRRRAPRYLLCAPIEGRAVPILEVLVERVDGDDLTVISAQAAAPGDSLVIHFRGADGASTARHVRVQSVSPVLYGNRAQFRLQLRLGKPFGKAAQSRGKNE